MTRETTPSEQLPEPKFKEKQKVWIKGVRNRDPHAIEEVTRINGRPYYYLDHSLAPYAEDLLTNIDPNTPTSQSS